MKLLSMSPSPLGSPRFARLYILLLQVESKMALTINWLGLSLILSLQDLSQTPLFERCWLGIIKLILAKDNKMIHFQVLGVGNSCLFQYDSRV